MRTRSEVPTNPLASSRHNVAQDVIAFGRVQDNAQDDCFHIQRMQNASYIYSICKEIFPIFMGNKSRQFNCSFSLCVCMYNLLR